MFRAMLLILLLPASALAETFAFDVTLGGVKVATLVVDGDEGKGDYRASSKVATTGLAGAVRPVRFAATVRGRVDGDALRPSTYSETIDTGRRQSSARLAWAGEVPQVLSYDSTEPATVSAPDPAAQRGTVDPLTALYAGMRPVAADRACRLALDIFDGRRRTAAALSTAGADADGTLTCAGVYRRIAGFSAQEMAERPRFSFAVTYAPGPDSLLHIDRIETDTMFGRAVLRRR